MFSLAYALRSTTGRKLISNMSRQVNPMPAPRHSFASNARIYRTHSARAPNRIVAYQQLCNMATFYTFYTLEQVIAQRPYIRTSTNYSTYVPISGTYVPKIALDNFATNIFNFLSAFLEISIEHHEDRKYKEKRDYRVSYPDNRRKGNFFRNTPGGGKAHRRFPFIDNLLF